jgi:hypothetical protein
VDAKNAGVPAILGSTTESASLLMFCDVTLALAAATLGSPKQF